jgi:hypothetical protein
MGERRPRPRKTTAQPVEPTDEDRELQEAIAQEQAIANEVQRAHLGQRVADLRKENNQLKRRVAELESSQPKQPQDRKPAKKTVAAKKTSAAPAK